jgi:hypothetical protein
MRRRPNGRVRSIIIALTLAITGVLAADGVVAADGAVAGRPDNNNGKDNDGSIPAVVAGPVDYRFSLWGDTSGATGWFYSDRDCGWPAQVEGRDSNNARVTRTIWIFCDSLGYSLTGEAWPSPYGFPSSTIGIADPDSGTGSDTGSDIASPVSWAAGDMVNGPSFLLKLVTDGANTVPGTCPSGYAEREWPRGAVTLPDADQRYETVVIIYQNFCVDFATFDFVAHGGGVAKLVWDADAPDAPIFATRLNDAWLKPGVQVDERSGLVQADLGWGTGNLLVERPDGDHHLYTYMCGGGGDCLVARTLLAADRSAADNAASIADPASWSYRGSTAWHRFPAAESDGSGTCSPTWWDNCGGFPAPWVAANAVTGDIDTQPAAEPSIKKAGNRYYLLYTPGYHDGYFVLRTAGTPIGPFYSLDIIQLPPGECDAGCRVPVWHPELDTEDTWAFSYYDIDGLNGAIPLDRDVGRIKVARIDIPASLYFTPPWVPAPSSTPATASIPAPPSTPATASIGGR